MESSPFFGPTPEVLVLLQFDLRGEQVIEQVRRIANLANSARGSIAGAPRLSVGIGPAYFDRPKLAGAAPRPRHLETLAFNGDYSHGLNIDSGQSDLLLAIGGSAELTAATARAAVAMLADSGWWFGRAHVGYDSGSHRDHTGFLDGTSNLQDLDSVAFGTHV